MEDMIQDRRARGCLKLMSRTFVSNRRSIKLHRAAGFHEASRKGDPIVWELDLCGLARSAKQDGQAFGGTY